MINDILIKLSDEDFLALEKLPKENLIEIIKKYSTLTDELSKELDNLLYVAYCDALTTFSINKTSSYEECKKKVFNRTYWETLYKPMHKDEELDFYLVDLNDLKKTNDEMGHLEGDKMICDCADLLSDYGTTFRLGGDEFAMVATNKRYQELFDEYLEKENELSFAWGYYHKKPQDSFDFVLKMADDSMYQTKIKMKVNKRNKKAPSEFGE